MSNLTRKPDPVQKVENSLRMSARKDMHITKGAKKERISPLHPFGHIEAYMKVHNPHITNQIRILQFTRASTSQTISAVHLHKTIWCKRSPLEKQNHTLRMRK